MSHGHSLLAGLLRIVFSDPNSSILGCCLSHTMWLPGLLRTKKRRLNEGSTLVPQCLIMEGTQALMVTSVQSLSHVPLFVTPWTAARQASLSSTNSWSLPKLMSIESVMPSNHLILYCPLLLLPSIFPASGSFPRSQFFASGGQSIGVSASASVLPMNIQD